MKVAVGSNIYWIDDNNMPKGKYAQLDVARQHQDGTISFDAVDDSTEPSSVFNITGTPLEDKITRISYTALT